MKTNKLFRYLCLSLSLITVSISCNKADSFSGSYKIRERVFAVSPSTKPIVKRIIDELKGQDQLTGIVSKIAIQRGFPKWDKALVKTKDNVLARGLSQSGDTIVIIPYRIKKIM